MKRLLLLTLSLILAISVSAQEKKEITKTGYNFGPLPAIAFDADKGFQLGALLNIYNYGDGSTYPNPMSHMYIEASWFTKGSMQAIFWYDNKTLIPGVRWSSAITFTNDKAMDFYGFNGYMSHYDADMVALGKDKKFFWEAGYHFSYFDQGYNNEGALNFDKINKGKDDNKKFPTDPADPRYESTIFDMYRRWGLISEDEAWGGINSTVRLGLLFDTRDKEGAPSRGIWAEGHVIIAPKWLGTTNPYYKYSLTFRHYVPIVKNDILTFAYRLNYEGTFGNDAPYYILPFITTVGKAYDRDGMGGYRTIRGIMRNRVQGLDMASYNAELRWRFVSFPLWKQNIAFGLSLFSDGTMVTKGRDMTFRGDEMYRAEYDAYMAEGTDTDRPHITVGAGLRFIMNQNFIVAFEYGLPISRLSSNPVIKNQDGKGAFYINTGYLF